MTTTPTRPLTIALAGNPNSGKTTLFNALTGLRQKTGNYPGVTVEKRVGKLRDIAAAVSGSDPSTVNAQLPTEIVDLPGTYSLISGSPDEKIAVDVLTGRMPGTPKPDAVIVVVDASNLQRNLYLVSQLIEMRIPMVVALNMMDIADRRGIRVQAELLQQKLGVPVVPIVGHKARGIDVLIRAISQAAVPPEPDWPLPDVFKRAVTNLAPDVYELAEQSSLSATACAERLLVGEAVYGEVPQTLADRVSHERQQLMQAGIDPMQADVEAHYQWIESVSHAVTSPNVDVRVRGQAADLRGTGVPPVSELRVPTHGRDGHATLEYAPKPSLTDRADRILLHKVWGLLAFALIMGGIFVSIFLIADPMMGFVESSIEQAGGLVAGVMKEGVLQDMWTDGIVAGVGGVLVFVPQIAILFMLLAILDDSGYLARAAFLMDRLLAKVGLSGKAFVPLLSGFACAIPGVMATRTIASPRDRLRTIFVLPFMSCAARLPVYALLIGAFFAANAWWVRGGIMLGLYLLGIAAAFLTAWIWKARSREPVSAFILELPIYKVPQWQTVLRVMAHNTWAFISRAGTIIFALSIILWALAYWPRLPEAQAATIKSQTEAELVQSKAEWEPLRAVLATNPDAEGYDSFILPASDSPEDVEARGKELLASAQLRHSFAGRFGHMLEPVIKPMGFDWKMGVGLVGAFAAREVFVATMGIVYAVGESEEDDTPLREAMMNDTWPDGSQIWTPLVAINMLIWFVLAMQCLSTVAIVKRETGGWKWPLLQLAYMNALAYVICVIVYQVGRALGG